MTGNENGEEKFKLSKLKIHDPTPHRNQRSIFQHLLLYITIRTAYNGHLSAPYLISSSTSRDTHLRFLESADLADAYRGNRTSLLRPMGYSKSIPLLGQHQK